jgi:hypothetical protein
LLGIVLTIFRAQLADLGVSFADCDVERHFLLLRLKDSVLVAEPAYAEWGDPWQQTLQAANAHSACYLEPVFRRVLAEILLLASGFAWGRDWRLPNPGKRIA